MIPRIGLGQSIIVSETIPLSLLSSGAPESQSRCGLRRGLRRKNINHVKLTKSRITSDLQFHEETSGHFSVALPQNLLIFLPANYVS